MPHLNQLNAKVIAALPIPAKGNVLYGCSGASVGRGQDAPRGLGIVVTSNGVRSFVFNYVLGGRERRYTIGRCNEWTVPRAVERIEELRPQINRGVDPLAEKHAKAPEAERTIRDIWLAWEKARALDKTKRDPVAQRGMFNRYILPKLGDLPFKSIRKSHVVELRDHIRDVAGPMAASKTISYLSAVLNWRATEYEDDWSAPRLSALKFTEVKRERVLSTEEIRQLWPAFDGDFGIMCKLLLLTSQRRNDIAMMRWAETDGRAVRVPIERYKGGKTSHEFPLSTAAAAILAGIPKRPGDDRVFRSVQFSRGKRALDKLVPTVEPWTLHDLRRTSATLMFEAGISIDVIDRVQGHAIAGQAKTYVRGSFMEQKRFAVDALAAAVERIINPAAANVVPLRA
jgi:integrase